MKKTTIATALGIVIGGASMGANAALTSSATLSFGANNGTETAGCTYGTTPPCNNKAYNILDLTGSWFAMDNGDGIATKNEKTPLTSLNGIHLGTTQSAANGHPGSINGVESPNIDNPWTFFGGTGMHQTTSPITAGAVTAGSADLDFSGWNVVWNGIASIPLVDKGVTTITCDTSDCSDSSNYTIAGEFHVSGGGFTTVTYFLNLEGTVTDGSVVPVPAAVWLFGSGLLGLAGVARRRKSA